MCSQVISMDVVSPHRDDAALSLSHTLRRVVAAGGNFRILSCFTITAWAPQVTGSVTTEGVSEMRRREDEAFINRFGTAGAVCSLDFVDGPLRADWSVQGREHVQRAYGPGSELVDRLATALRARRRDGGIWAVPMAVGHRDHLACLWAGIAAAVDAPLLCYEDQPYALRASPDDLANQAARVAEHACRSLVPVRLAGRFAADDWIDDLSCYASQFSPSELGELARQVAERGGERCWVDDRAKRLLDPLIDSRIIG